MQTLIKQKYQIIQVFYALNLCMKFDANLVLNHFQYYKHRFDLQVPIDKLDIRSDLFVGDVFIFINFTCFGLFLVLSKSMIEKYSSMGLSVLVMSIGALLLIPVAGYGIYNNWESWLNLSWWIYFAAFYSIFFATVITYSLNYYAMEYVDSSKVALFIYLQPVVAGTLSVAFGKDEITTRLILSSVLIMLGLLLSTVETKSTPKVGQ